MTTNLYYQREPDEWEEVFPTWLICALSRNWEGFLRSVDWYRRNHLRFDERLVPYTILRELGLYMPRKRGSNGSAGNIDGHNSRSESGGTEWKWANIPLESADIEHLEQSDLTFEFLAAAVVLLADDGIGVTVKPIDGGKSICCTLYRSDPDNSGVIVGVSSFGGNTRDALLVSVYKLDTKLGGEFSNVSEYVSDTKPRQRFR
jgi:hypothetical protein